MNKIGTIKKINIIILVIFTISMIFSNNIQAVGNAFSDADEFLEKRKCSI